MKQLTIVRHADAMAHQSIRSDIERPLSVWGYEEAHLVCTVFKKQKVHPELIFCSPAVRTYTTSIIFARALELKPEKIRLSSQLYYGELEKYEEVISEIPDEHSSVMIVGHNPLISALVEKLTRGTIRFMNTCDVVITQSVEKEWSHFLKGEITFSQIQMP